MSTVQLWSWMVVFTEDGAVDVVEAVTRHQAVPACGTGETLEGKKSGQHQLAHLYQDRRADAEVGTHFQVVNAPLSSHHHLTGRDGLSTCTAGSSVSKQSAKPSIQAVKAPFHHDI